MDVEVGSINTSLLSYYTSFQRKRRIYHHALTTLWHSGNAGSEWSVDTAFFYFPSHTLPSLSLPLFSTASTDYCFSFFLKLVFIYVYIHAAYIKQLLKNIISL